MAFSTEFIFGGGKVEYVPVNWTGTGTMETQIDTFDAGAGSVVEVKGVATLGSTSSSSRPLLVIGTEEIPYTIAEMATGIVRAVQGVTSISLKSRTSNASTLAATVNRGPFVKPPRFTYAAGSTTRVILDRDVPTTFCTFTASSSGLSVAQLVIVPSSYSSYTVRLLRNGAPMHEKVSVSSGNPPDNLLGMPATTIEVNVGETFELVIAAHNSSSAFRNIDSWSLTFS